jgi:hypothetical protein
VNIEELNEHLAFTETDWINALAKAILLDKVKIEIFLDEDGEAYKRISVDAFTEDDE